MKPPGVAAATSGAQVLIAGGGPVGLTLAALLGRHGIRTVVIEADDGYCSGSRAICVSRRSMEILGWAGAVDHVRRIGLPWVGGRSYFRNAEVLHFTMPSAADDRFAPMTNIQQYHVEEAAHRAIDPALTDVRWSTRVVDVRDAGEGVQVDVVDASGRSTTLHTDWLVACDGGRSSVRERLGLTLSGMQYEGRYVIVDIEQETERAVERLAWFDPPSNPGSTLLMHRQPGGVWRIDYQIGDDEDAEEAVRAGNVLPRVQSHLAMIGETAPWKPLWISIYNAKCLTLDRYRHGHVLFAGDAAHLVPIFGVRGLNSGIDDVGNLAWKLARVVNRQSPHTLLDSYADERLQAARENIAFGAKSTEFMAPPHHGFRLMREAALRLALEDDAVRSLINPRQSEPVPYRASRPDEGFLVGHPAPEAGIAGAGITHLTQLFGRGFVALRFDERRSVREPTGTAELWHVLPEGEPGTDTVIDRSGLARQRYRAAASETVLVRPDGYVAARWQSTEADALDRAIARASGREELPA